MAQGFVLEKLCCLTRVLGFRSSDAENCLVFLRLGLSCLNFTTAKHRIDECVCACIYIYICTYRQTDRQTDRQADRETDVHMYLFIYLYLAC